MSIEINEQEIVEYYDKCQIDYELVWHLGSKMCMHYGYWDDDTPNLRDALVNMNRKVAEYAGIRRGDRVLDAGCGVGGSSIFLAKTFGCTTVGITLSEHQVETCRANAAKHGVDGQCSFDKQSYLSTDFEDASFDVVWAIESVCYAYDKADFLREAYRVLRPGGTLIVADFFSHDVPQDEHKAHLIKKMANTWAIRAFADEQEFGNKMAELFVACKKHDATRNVVKSIRRLYYASFFGLPITYVSQALGFRNKTQTDNTWSTYYQYKAYKEGLWHYIFFSAKKPKNE